MARLIRRYELLIGDPYELDPTKITLAPFLTPEDKLNALEDGIRKANEDRGGFRITELHIEFSVEKTNQGTSPNTSTIKVANLSDKVVKYLENRSGKKTVILLKCGYEGEDLKTVIVGNLEKYKDSFNNETRWTELFVVDGGANYQNTLTSRFYPKGTNVDSIVSDLMGDINLPKSGGYVADTGAITEKAFYFNGNVFDQLHRLAVYYDYRFSVQDGTCFWMPIGVGFRKNAVVISPNTGLIGDISPIDATQGVSQNNSTELNPGVKFTTLLNGSLLPETTVKLKSRNKTGNYKINKVTHKGSYEGASWVSEVEAEEVGII